MDKPIETRSNGDGIATDLELRRLPNDWIQVVPLFRESDGALYEVARISMPRSVLVALATYVQEIDSCDLHGTPKPLLH